MPKALRPSKETVGGAAQAARSQKKTTSHASKNGNAVIVILATIMPVGVSPRGSFGLSESPVPVGRSRHSSGKKNLDFFCTCVSRRRVPEELYPRLRPGGAMNPLGNMRRCPDPPKPKPGARPRTNDSLGANKKTVGRGMQISHSTVARCQNGKPPPPPMTTPRRHRSEGEGRVGGQRGLPACHHSTVVNANAAPPYTQAPHEGVRSFPEGRRGGPWPVK